MNKTLTNLFIFAAGAAIGSAVTWMYAKKHYEQVADEEIESMKEWVARREEALKRPQIEDKDTEVNRVIPEKPDLKEYVSRLKECGYIDYANGQKPEDEPEEVKNVTKPRIISPEEFGEEDYREISLTYYADGVLADEDDNIVEDLEGTVGEDYASHFGEYEEDSVFVRNDDTMTDYEILRDLRCYSDIYQSMPYPTEDE